MPHLLIYGDSNTKGVLPVPDRRAEEVLPPGEAWPGRLAIALGPSWRVTALGLPGRTFCLADPVDGAWKDGLRHLPVAAGTHGPADVVAVMLGTNDQKARFAMTATDIGLCAERMLREIAVLFPGAARLLICPPAVQEVGALRDMFAGAAPRSAALPGAMRDAASAAGSAFFDAGTVIATDPVDGVHFGAEAHAALAEAIHPVVMRFP